MLLGMWKRIIIYDVCKVVLSVRIATGVIAWVAQGGSARDDFLTGIALHSSTNYLYAVVRLVKGVLCVYVCVKESCS